MRTGKWVLEVLGMQVVVEAVCEDRISRGEYVEKKSDCSLGFWETQGGKKKINQKWVSEEMIKDLQKNWELKMYIGKEARDIG